MAQIFRVILSLSVSGGLIGLLIMLLRPATRRVFAKKWTYYLWLLVLVRVMVPIHVDVNMMEYLSGKLAQVQSLQVNGNEVSDSITSDGITRMKQDENVSDGIIPMKQDGNVSNRIVGNESPEKESVTADMENAGEISDTAALSRTQNKRDMFFLIAGILWMAGMILSVIWRLYTYRGFVREIRADWIPVTDQGVLATCAEVQRRLRIGCQVPLYESGSINSPMLIGLIKPCIVLPSELLAGMRVKGNDMCLILHHELVHYKRRDIWYKWLFQAVLCIHWFNPLLYLFNRKFNIDCELACDEMVMALLTEEGRRAYGDVLLDVAEKYFLEHSQTAHKNIPAMTLLEEKRTLKERLRGIARYHKKGLVIGICSLAMLAVLITTAVICGVSGVQSHTGQTIVLSNGAEFSFDDMVSGPMLVSKKGNAYQIYDDNTLIAGNCESDVWRAHSYKGGGKSVECRKFQLNGSDILWIMYANKETTLEISSVFTLQKGRFKIVQVTPDGMVHVLNENGEKTKEEVTLSKGRNCFKIVGQEARLEDLTAAYDGMKEKDIDGIYRSEAEEYGYLVMAGLAEMDISRLEEVYPYLEKEEVSKLCQSIWEKDVELSDADWQDLFLYSDSELTTRYLLEALEDGRAEGFDSRILGLVACYMEEDDVSECFRYLLEKEKVRQSDWEDIFIYSDAELSAEYLVKALQSGKRNGFNDKALGQICYRVSTQSLTDIVTVLTKEELTFAGLLEHVLPFVQKQDEVVTCVCYYIDLGNVLTDAQLWEIMKFVSEEDFYRIVEYNGKRK